MPLILHFLIGINYGCERELCMSRAVQRKSSVALGQRICAQAILHEESALRQVFEGSRGGTAHSTAVLRWLALSTRIEATHMKCILLKRAHLLNFLMWEARVSARRDMRGSSKFTLSLESLRDSKQHSKNAKENAECFGACCLCKCDCEFKATRKHADGSGRKRKKGRRE